MQSFFNSPCRVAGPDRGKSKLQRLARLYLALPPVYRTVCVATSDACPQSGEKVVDLNRARVCLQIQGFCSPGKFVYLVFSGPDPCKWATIKCCDCPDTWTLDQHYTLVGSEVWASTDDDEATVSVMEVCYRGVPEFCGGR